MDIDLIFIFEMIGTVAFAVAGSLVGILKKMDIFGIAVLGMTTAVGGGIIRDLVLGRTPPVAFVRPVYALTAIVTSLIVFLPAVRNFVEHHQKGYEGVMRLMDAIGLGAFTVIGAEAAFTCVPDPNVFLAVFTGAVTGVGGGALRDVLAGEVPYIFVKHFYACASIIGAIAYCILRGFLGIELAMILGVAVVVVLRLLAAKYRWTLPRP
jgi:uncharacterized membrane protein YeiH